MSKGLKFGYEKRDTNLPVLGKLVMALVVFIVVSLVAMKLLFGVFLNFQVAGEPPTPPMAGTDAAPPEPRLETYESEVIITVRAYESSLLQGYAWVDQEAGIARIPIQRAMELLAQPEQQP